MSESHEHAGLIAFRYSNFTLFVVARFFLVAALEMQSVAVGWQIYEITRRPLDLGLVGLAQFLPVVFFFLPAGHAADRFNRRSMVVVCYIAFAVTRPCRSFSQCCGVECHNLSRRDNPWTCTRRSALRGAGRPCRC